MYPQSMFWNKNKKSRYTHVKLSFTIMYITMGFQGIYILRASFPDEYYKNLVALKLINRFYNCRYWRRRIYSSNIYIRE